MKLSDTDKRLLREKRQREAMEIAYKRSIGQAHRLQPRGLEVGRQTAMDPAKSAEIGCNYKLI